MILESLGAMLIGKGVNYIGSLFDSATDEGLDRVSGFIEEKTGIKVKSKEDVAALTPEQITALKQLESTEKLKLAELALQEKKIASDERVAHYSAAHETYRIKNEAADEIAGQIIKYNLPIIAMLVLVNIAVVYYMAENATLIAIASNIIGLAIGNLFNERNTIVNFFFGSSQGSKSKDKTIELEAMKSK
jgi:uncharacterized membrane protein